MLIERGHMHCIVATVITLVAMFVVRFIVTDRVIYRLRQRRS
jgi:putative flippase GtrA